MSSGLISFLPGKEVGAGTYTHGGLGSHRHPYSSPNACSCPLVLQDPPHRTQGQNLYSITSPRVKIAPGGECEVGTTPKGRTQALVHFPGPRNWERLPGKTQKKKKKKKQREKEDTGHTHEMKESKVRPRSKTGANVLTGRGPARRGRDAHGGMRKGGARGDGPGQRRRAAASGF